MTDDSYDSVRRLLAAYVQLRSELEPAPSAGGELRRGRRGSRAPARLDILQVVIEIEGAVAHLLRRASEVAAFDPDEPIPHLITPARAAPLLGISKARVHQLMGSGELPLVRLEGRVYTLDTAVAELGARRGLRADRGEGG